jgi:hypothetical protein
VIRDIGFTGDCPIYPDLAHSLASASSPTAPNASESRRPWVAINAMPALDGAYWPNGTPENAAAYRGAIDTSVEGLSATLEAADYVVATRCHGALLPLAMGLATLAISYNPKTAELMKLMGQGRFSLDLEGLSAASLLDTFRALEASAADQCHELRRRAEFQNRALGEQYDQIVRLAIRRDPTPPAYQLA